MAVCTSCGGSNAAGASSCEYCGSPLDGRQQIDVAWVAHSGEGARAEGYLTVEAPADTDAARVRALAEAAFAASHDALGSGARRETLEAAMRERLEQLAAGTMEIRKLGVTTYSPPQRLGAAGAAAPSPAPAPAASAPSRGRLFSCAIGAFALLQILCGGLCLTGSVAAKREAAAVAGARVLSPEEAAAASGLVCVEAVRAELAEPPVARTDEAEIPCVYLKETRVTEEQVSRRGRRGRRRTSTETTRHPAQIQAPEFRLGPLTVRPSVDASWKGARTLGVRTVDEQQWYELEGIPLDTPLTALGTVEDGVLQEGADELFVISTQPSHAALVSELRGASQGMQVLGIVALALGALLLLGSLAFAQRRG